MGFIGGRGLCTALQRHYPLKRREQSSFSFEILPCSGEQCGSLFQPARLFVEELLQASLLARVEAPQPEILSDSDLVSGIALSPSTVENGCMRVAPGTHTHQIHPHRETWAEDNMLSRGQEIQVEVNEDDVVDVVLQPGEMSLHHVNIIHGSNPNPTDIARIGLSPASVSPSVTSPRRSSRSSPAIPRFWHAGRTTMATTS